MKCLALVILFLISALPGSLKAETYDLSDRMTEDMMAGDPPRYQVILNNLKPDDVLVFKHDGKVVSFTVAQPIGHGGTTMVILTTTGKVLRVNYQMYGDYLEAYREGQRAFAKKDASVVKIYEEESHIPKADKPQVSQYLVTEYLDFKSGGINFTLYNLLPYFSKGFDKTELAKIGLTVEQGHYLINKLSEALRHLSTFKSSEDFQPTNLAYVPSRGEWVIFDFMGKPTDIDPVSKEIQSTLLDNALWDADFKNNPIVELLKKRLYIERYKRFPYSGGCHSMEHI